MKTNVVNFLPEQYKNTNKIPINHNYLAEQFSDYEDVWKKMREVVIRGDFTLGEEVDRVEEEFAKLANTKHAIGVGSGTDALFLSLKALGIGAGDEVITTTYTFYATIGAIVTAGAIPVFVDIGDDANIDPLKIEGKITKNTKAIMPVHWSGKPCDMDLICRIAEKHKISVVSDACHAINATYKNIPVGAFGTISCFSFHPLKNLNIWGDGGIIVTDSTELADKLKLLRNHGLVGRNECEIFAYNSRLDTIQAVVARHMLSKIDHITKSRVANASFLDLKLSSISRITIPRRDSEACYQVFHLYQIQCEKRDELQNYLIENGVDAKVHYPIPMHLQPAADFLGHKVGDFPIAEALCKNTLSLPVHEFISKEQLDRMVSLIKEFYGE